MRQLETFQKEADARALADAMYTDGIETTVSTGRDGVVALWVHDDARLDEARDLLARFRTNPDDPRFTEGAKVAREKRRAEEKRNRETEKRVESARRDLERRTGVGTATLFFVFASVGVWVMQGTLDTTSLLGAISFAGPSATSTFASIASGEVWRLVTPSFIAGSLFSLLFSSLFMIVLGSAFEQRHSSRYMVLIALVSAAAANAFTAYMLGPSAAYSTKGIEAALFAYLFVRHRLDPREWDPPPYGTMFWIPLWFVVSLAITSMRALAYMDIAGFAIGGLSALFAARR